MRRLTGLLMCVAMLITLAACQRNENAEQDKAPAESTTAVQPERTEEAVTEPQTEILVPQEEVAPTETAPGQKTAAEESPPQTAVQRATKFVEGVNYQVLPQPVPTNAPNRIEVTELFWYGCSHCFDFEPIVSAWAAKLPQDVVFTPSPAIWHESMEPHARAFYTAKALGVLDKLHVPIFEALNLRKEKLQSEDEIADLFVAHGVDREKFLKTYNSFGVTNSVRQAEARQRGYKTEGTPEMVVDGKYRIDIKMANIDPKTGDFRPNAGKGFQGMLDVASYLIEKERKLKSK